jgi:hypothetical protein
MPDVERLIPDPLVAKEFHITTMTIWRWDRSPAKMALGWPVRVQIGGRNYRSRSQLEKFKANLLALALAEREGVRGVGGEAAA